MEMARLSSALLLLVAFCMFACDEDNIPEGLYDYQVVRLLASDTSKVWQLANREPGLCDSIYFYEFTNLLDSVAVAEIRWNCDIQWYADTVALGFAVPSSIGLSFSDSLIFSDDEYWEVRTITSQSLDLIQYPASQSVQLLPNP